jgi:hypothetical protein
MNSLFNQFFFLGGEKLNFSKLLVSKITEKINANFMYQENKANSFLIEHFKVDTHNLVIKKNLAFRLFLNDNTNT